MKKRLQYLLIGSFAFLFINCSSSSWYDLKQLKNDLNVTNFPEQADYPQADAVILEHSTYTEMDVVDSRLETYETVIVMKKLFKNIESNASEEIYIYEGEKLNGIEAYTIKPDGTIMKLNENDYYYKSGEGNDNIFYTDRKSVKFTFPAIEKGCIVAYRYKKTKSHPFERDYWSIQHFLPTLMNKYEIAIPRILLMKESDGGLGWDWLYKAYNFFIDAPNIQKQVENKSFENSRINFYWDLRNIPAFEPENKMPSVENYISHMCFSPSDWKKWNDFSSWYYKKHFVNQIEITDRIIETAKQVTAGATTDDEKIEKLFNYVKNMRYIAIELGRGGITPTKPQLVLERQYGDCKDKSTLLYSLLKSQNIKAYPVLALTKEEGELDASFPSWNFNHMILKATTATGKSYWLDATVKHCPLGKLPSNCEGINVLVIMDDGNSNIETTPTTNSNENRIEINLNSNIKDNDTSVFNIEYLYYGEYNIIQRYNFEDKTEKEMKEICKFMINDEFVNAEIKNYKISDIDFTKKGLKLSFTFSIANSIQKQGDLNFVNIDPLKLVDNVDWLIKDKREYPLDFNFPHSIKKNITINLPDNYSLRSVPDNISLYSNEISYKKEFNSEDKSKLTINEFYVINKEYISPKKYQDSKNIFETIKNKNNDKIVLIRQ